MDKEKIGEFISVLRKEREMTQKELADKLGLTDKAISKWERGLSYPDISMLEPIANVLQVSVVELLKGERIGSDATITMQEAQQIVNESISISEDKHIKKQNIHKKIIYMLCCIMIFLLSWLMNAPYFLYTAILVMIALPGISFAKKKTFVDEPHSYDVFKRLQGLFTIVILIHQLDERIWEFSEYGGELSWYRPFGVLLMGFFFFSFGYEVVISLQTEKNYLKTFLLHRIGMVLGTFFICNSAYIFITLLQGTRYTTDVLIKAFLGVLLLNDHMWFLVEILLLYTVFYIGFCFIKNNIVQYGWMLAVILFIMVISFLNGHDIAGKTSIIGVSSTRSNLITALIRSSRVAIPAISTVLSLSECSRTADTKASSV